MHSLLAPSAAHRWINCPASLYLQENKLAGVAAQEGSTAHDLAYKMLTNKKWDQQEYPLEMVSYVTEYVNFVKSLTGIKYFEQKVNIFNKCFGTVDTIIFNWNKLHIIDLKYGKNIPVSILWNEQLMLYAWGAYRTLWDTQMIIGKSEEPHLIRITIYQPRTMEDDLIKSQTIRFSDLLDFILKVKPKAKLAVNGSHIRKSGDWCMFCEQKFRCPERNIKCAWR
jgi:hypothetical protein